MRLSTSAALSGFALLVLGTSVSAQIADLQPGRNFPSNVSAFGSNHSENIDVADIDHDGDYDVAVSNGGDSGPQPNRLFLNNGGAQGGTLGTFSQVTSTRFAGFPNDTSRDVEFADFENDGDFDIYISNRGLTTNNGETSRAYINQGGQQTGTLGFYSEETATFWGNLISVNPALEIGGPSGSGPFRDFSCDCDFADFNDDGYIDLFHSSYGPNINGTTDSRLFLNDGTGVFNEEWPWVDGVQDSTMDIRLHTLDIDPVDFDGDYDIDVFGSSRDSQARVYRNNLNGGGGGNLFTDMTQSALLNTGAGLNGSNNYEAEFADVDGDGDFDMYMKNYDGGGGGNLDRILRNNGNFTFTKMNAWIKGDPNIDENEADFFDFDNDGDLDVFVANFLGTNRLYASSLAQGIPFNQGILHRTGTAGLYPNPELPAANNGFQSLDGECADMDNDGDTDILLSNDSGQVGRYYENTLASPDTFAPTFFSFTDQGNKADGSDTVIHAAVRDNAAYYIIGYYDVNLIYTVNGGQERTVKMFSQGSQQFRGVIPGGHNGTIAYRIAATDDAGNKGVSATRTYNQTASGVTVIESLSTGTAGIQGRPYFSIDGDLVTGNTTQFKLEDAAPNAIAALFLSLMSTPAPFKGGILYTVPVSFQINRTTDEGGFDHLTLPWPAFPAGFEVFFQYGIQDLSVPGPGATLSNGVKTTTP